MLNLTYGHNLRNLNEKRKNTPGIDLGDANDAPSIAYQITSQATSQKVKKTLEKITDDQLKQFSEIYVLIIGEKQSSYTLDAKAAKRCRFDEDHIMDVTDLCRDIMSLELPKLRALHQKISDEQRRVRIELEPQLPDGKFKTSIGNFIEMRADYRPSDASKFFSDESTEGLFKDQSEAKAALDEFCEKLSNLPRLTREFLGLIVDQAEYKTSLGGMGLEMNADLLEAKGRHWPDFNLEVRILRDLDYIDIDHDGISESPRLSVWFPNKSDGSFSEAMMYFLKENKLEAQTLFSTMNFSDFGPLENAQ